MINSALFVSVLFTSILFHVSFSVKNPDLASGEVYHFTDAINYPNYVGVSVGRTASEELTRDEAETYCNTHFKTSLATILDSIDQTEIVAVVSDTRWSNAVDNVYIGWKSWSSDNTIKSWAPCEACGVSMGCSAYDETEDESWHVNYGSFNTNNYCGTIKRNTANVLGKWDTQACGYKRDFICNNQYGKYDPVPFSCTAACASDVALNIGFLIDESGSIDSDEFATMNTFIKRLVEYDLNLISSVSLFQYADENDFSQILDWTSTAGTGKTTITNAINANSKQSGGTYTGHAITNTLTSFDTTATNNILFVLTDGDSTDEVCERTGSIDVGNVKVVIIAIGSGITIDSNVFGCLYDSTDSSDDIFTVSSFTGGDFLAIEDGIRDITCQSSLVLITNPDRINNNQPISPISSEFNNLQYFINALLSFGWLTISVIILFLVVLNVFIALCVNKWLQNTGKSGPDYIYNKAKISEFENEDDV